MPSEVPSWRGLQKREGVEQRLEPGGASLPFLEAGAGGARCFCAAVSSCNQMAENSR